MVDVSAWSKDLAVEIGGRDVINHAGAAALRLLADRTGLTRGLSRALARRGFLPVHDRGRVLADTAVLIADGGRVMSDLATLRDQAELYGPVASDPTLWRTLDEVGATQRRSISRERAKTRAHVWSLIEQRHGAIPPSRVADRDLGRTIVIRMDASLVIAHSDKQLAAGTYKGTWGHHPLMAWCDNTGESLALLLRRGSAGSNTLSDHLDVLEEAITQIPARYRRNLLITLDGAGASHGLIDHITNLNASPWRSVQYSIGWDLGARERAAIGHAPQHTWDHVLDIEGAPRDLDEAGVLELTALLREGPAGDQLANWPKDLRIICRREKPHPGAQLSLFEAIDGWRYQLLATNTPATTAQFLRGPPPTTRPRGGHHPHREAHRPRTPTVDLDRDQPSLVCGRDHRLRPTVLAAAALPARTTGQRRTQDPALPAAAHRRPHRARPTQTQDPHTRNLALGKPTRHLLPRHTRPASTTWTLINATHPRPKEQPPDRGTRRPPNATAGPAA